jgi:hypothetical protein
MAEVEKMVKKHRKGVTRINGEQTNKEISRGNPYT